MWHKNIVAFHLFYVLICEAVCFRSWGKHCLMHLPCDSHQGLKFLMGWLWFLQVITMQCQGSEAGIRHVDDTPQKGK